MMGLFFFSVIIPVHNIEQYIDRCVSSVVSQNVKEQEIILVDDGSTDSCPQICDDWAAKDDRIRVIHKKNGGLSDARNTGIMMARGQYVIFLDGDDYWADDGALLRLADRISLTHADVLNYSYQKVFVDDGKAIPFFRNVPPMPSDRITKDAQLDYLREKGLYIASACNKMIRRELLDEELLFEKGVFSEDIVWCARLLRKARSLDFVCENFYCYRQNPSSITHSIGEKNCRDLTGSILSCISMAQQSEGALRRCLLHYAAYQYGTFFPNQARADAPPYACIEKLTDYSWILKYHERNRKLLLLNCACKLLGFRNVCALFRRVF